MSDSDFAKAIDGMTLGASPPPPDDGFAAAIDAMPNPDGSPPPPPQNYSWYRPLVLGGQAIAGGITNLFGALGDENQLRNQLIQKGGKLLRIPTNIVNLADTSKWPEGLQALAPGLTMAPTSNELAQGANALAPVEPGSLPQFRRTGAAERYGYGALEAAPSAVLGMATGMPWQRALAATLASNTSGQLVNDFVPNTWASKPYLGMVAGGLTGLAFGNGNPQKALADFADRLHPTAENVADVGKSVQDFARQWLQTTDPIRQAAMHDYVRSLAHPASPLLPTAFGQTLDQLQGNAGNWQKLNDFFRKSGIKQLAGIADDDPGIKNPITGQWNLTSIDAANQVRQRIGKALGDPTIRGDVDRTELKALYSALSDDLRDAHWAAGGPEAEQGWENANRVSSETIDTRDNLLSRYVKGISQSQADPDPGKLGASILNNAKSSGEEIKQIAREVASDPNLQDPRRAIAAVAIRNSLKKANGDSTVGLDWSKLSDSSPISGPGAKEALLGDPALVRWVDQMVKASAAPKGNIIAKSLADVRHNVGAGFVGAALNYLHGSEIPDWLAGGGASIASSLANQAYRRVKADPALLRNPLLGGYVGASVNRLPQNGTNPGP